MPASNPAWTAAITSCSELFGPQCMPPASHEPNPTTEISGPPAPSCRICIPGTLPGASGARAWAVGEPQQVALGKAFEPERAQVDPRLVARDHGGSRLRDGRCQLQPVTRQTGHRE